MVAGGGSRAGYPPYKAIKKQHGYGCPVCRRKRLAAVIGASRSPQVPTVEIIRS
jgi:hypothetical protein